MSDTHDVTISGFDLDRLESELAEAREQRDKWSNLWADLSRSCVKDIAKLERELADVQQQRDRLAEAAHYMRQAMKDDPCMWNYAIDFYESTINQIKQNDE